MNKLFILLMSIAWTFSAYAHDAIFDLDTGKLDLPTVEVISQGEQQAVYKVEMSRVESPLLITFSVDPNSLTEPESILKRIQERKNLACGGRIDLPGHGTLDPATGRNVGFDIDLCRAVAAAVLNNSGEIKFVNIKSTEEKIEKLRTREIDILSRNTTWTTSREDWGDFVWIMFYDEQGFIAPNNSDISNIADLEEKTICVTDGTTTEQNLKDHFELNNWGFESRTSIDIVELFEWYEDGLCEAITADKSMLYANQARLTGEHNIFNQSISKEPLSPMVPSGDKQWLSIVRTVMFGLINAEELRITQSNVDKIINDDPEVEHLRNNSRVRRLLGIEGTFGQEIFGLEKEAIAQAIRAVGNYGEIYNRNFPLRIDERNYNDLGTNGNGGLIYAPPMR